MLATLVLCLFAGIRPEEARRMEWVNIGPEFIEITGAKSKTRRRRLVPITPQLRAWLDVAHKMESELPARNFPNKFNRVRRLAKILDGWPQDAMRHSFASYHLAKHRNENETALVMGNSPQMLFNHYRALVRPDEATKFFSIMPGDEVNAAKVVPASVTVQAAPNRAAANRGNCVVTKNALGAVFQQGTRTLPRAEVIRELCDVHGLSPSTAFAAISPQGRFREHLREVDGVLSWNPFPEKSSTATPAAA